eukprot:3217642-Rhodomonas_salina.1
MRDHNAPAFQTLVDFCDAATHFLNAGLQAPACSASARVCLILGRRCDLAFLCVILAGAKNVVAVHCQVRASRTKACAPHSVDPDCGAPGRKREDGALCMRALALGATSSLGLRRPDA